MSGIEMAVAMALLIAFIGGVVTGVVVLVSVASRREDRLFTLTGEAPDALCRGARRLIGVWTRSGRPADPMPRLKIDAHGRNTPR
jgi:hypothetical protein